LHLQPVLIYSLESLLLCSKQIKKRAIGSDGRGADSAVNLNNKGGSRVVQKLSIPQAADRIPQHSFATTQTLDAEAHARCITGWRSVYEHVGRQPFRGQITELCLGPIQIIHERLDQPCVCKSVPWSGALLFVSFVETRGNVFCGGRDLIPSAVTAFPGEYGSQFCSAPTESLTIAVHEDALADYTREELGREISREALRDHLHISDAGTVDEFQRCATSILSELAADAALLDSDAYRTMVKRRVLKLLLSLISTASPQRLAPPSTRSYIVQKAARYMDTHLSDRLMISEVCDALRVCPRTLRYSFQEIVGVSPAQYLLALRLGRVRRELLRTKNSTYIQCIANQYGLSHMGRLAQFYRNAFGERPSDTCRRAASKQQFAVSVTNA
jgi:AraC family ethanolamine operon transcriptional activator